MTQQATAEETLQAAREAISRYGWQEAFDAFASAKTAGASLTASDCDDFAQAAWWTGHIDTCIEARERAYADYLASGENRRAALLALALARDYGNKLDRAIAAGWFNTAERLLEKEEESVEHGYLARARANAALTKGDLDLSLTHLDAALDLATRFGDRNLQALSLHDQGRVLVVQGKVEEGLALMDEATVAAVAGELAPLPTAVIYCNTIVTCSELADYRRAGEWTEAAKRWCERQSIAGFPGICRVHRAEIMRLRGAWVEAEQEAARACVELRDSGLLSFAGEGFYELGEIRLRMGDLEEAQAAFSQAHELGRDPQPGMALLLLAQGKVGAAAAAIKGALADDSRERLARARLLAPAVDILIAAGDVGAASTAAEELERIANEYKTSAFLAAAHAARGAVSLRKGDPGVAVSSLRRALIRWNDVDAPYEGARTRVLLADALAAHGDLASATLELQAAKSAFERLGAEPDARHITALLERHTGRDGGRVGTKRETKTFMFTDIVKSTNLVEAIGDEAWEDVVRWHDQTLRSLFRAGGGEEINHAGDGFFVAFEEPRLALECAVAIQRSLADHRRSHGFAPQVRIGLHTAEATSGDGTFRGKGVHEAARVGGLAEGGEVLVSEATLADAGDSFPISAPRRVTLKGIAEPVNVLSVDWR